jgi:hypothetical protein
MEERTRLGRGLEEVSRLYLSERPREAALKELLPQAFRQGRRVVRVFHPGSPLAKAIFVTNFALELARSRRPVTLWDGHGGDDPNAGSLMGGIARQDIVPEALAVRLYGLPDIVIYGPEAHGDERLTSLAHEAGQPDGKDFLLLSFPDTVESVVRSVVPFDAIMLCPLEEAPLLKVYAFIKVIRESDPASRISVAFDGAPSEGQAREVFSRLDEFMRNRGLGPLSFIGVLHHDEALERSVEERMPLMLGHGPSTARDSLAALSGAFLQSAGMARTGAGEP